MIKCGAYLRISKEDENRQEESNSIGNQRLLIQQYLSQNTDMVLVDEWVDDGYSGSDFNRPGVQNMLEDARQHKIDCIVVKDISRFGREYIQTGYYLQRIFPVWGIRFIAILDHYDSNSSDLAKQSLLLPIMTLMNDAYLQDISQKVKSGLQAKRQAGQFLGAFAPYGYQKSKTDHNVLEIDEDSAVVVRKIFSLKCMGYVAEEIADILNVLLVPSPSTYKYLHRSKYHSGFAKQDVTPWSPVGIRRILKNELYVGILAQGKTRKESFKSRQRKQVQREEWIRVEGVVPAIIEQTIFIQVNQNRKKT